MSTVWIAAAVWIGVVGCAYPVHPRVSGRNRIEVVSLHTLPSIESVFVLTVGPSHDRRGTASRYAMAGGADPQACL